MKQDLHIVHVEDNPAHALLLKHCLEQEGFSSSRLLHYKDGAEACRRLSESHQQGDDLPDIIFLDLQMPFVSGFDVLRMIRSHGSLCAVPVIIFSTSGRQQDITTAYQLGADDYLVKPVSFTDLCSNLKGVFTKFFAAEPSRDHRNKAAICGQKQPGFSRRKEHDNLEL